MIPRAHIIVVMFACACSTEPAMSAPNPPTPVILSAFNTLQGGQKQVIAPGEPLVTWWESGILVAVPLPTGVNGYGARRIPGGKTMRSGLAHWILWHVPGPRTPPFRP